MHPMIRFTKGHLLYHPRNRTPHKSRTHTAKLLRLVFSLSLALFLFINKHFLFSCRLLIVGSSRAEAANIDSSPGSVPGTGRGRER